MMSRVPHSSVRIQMMLGEPGGAGGAGGSGGRGGGGPEAANRMRHECMHAWAQHRTHIIGNTTFSSQHPERIGRFVQYEYGKVGTWETRNGAWVGGCDMGDTGGGVGGWV